MRGRSSGADGEAGVQALGVVDEITPLERNGERHHYKYGLRDERHQVRDFL